MGGGLMQLVAYGAQDIYLTGNPQITFFKVVYRRHTNFSMEAIQQTFSGTADFGNDVSATISRNGDLVYRMYLEHDASFQATAGDNEEEIGVVTNYGSRLMKECELEIGGQRIDKHYGHWHEVYSQLTEFNPSGSDTTLFNRMTGNGYGIQTDDGATNVAAQLIKGWTTTQTEATQTASGKFWIPLYFWFCRNPGLALPLIALQYHEVKVKITFEDVGNLAMTAAADADWAGGSAVVAAATDDVVSASTSFNLWCDYIYLDTDERRRFAQVSHEYLIEQVQHASISDTGTFTQDLNFNHPVKELIWSSVPSALGASVSTGAGAADNQAKAPIGPIDGNYQLKLNGHDRFKERDYRYFTRTQVLEHHTGHGGIFGSDGTTAKAKDFIGVYSFALKPEEHQPSGTCNFSRIDNAQLVRSSSSTTITGGFNIYAVNYNVLRIMSGMGGLAYSN